MRLLLLVVLELVTTMAIADVRPADLPFTPHLIDPGASESAAVADINRDKRLDIISGEYWYEAPARGTGGNGWTPHRFRELNFINGYIDNFSDLPIDVDGDGYPDIVSVSWFGKTISWWKNPGQSRGMWTETVIDSGFPVEFAFLVDLDNDGKALEVLPQFGEEGAPLAWYEVNAGKWVRHIVSPLSYGHGIGAGDVNGDGRTDILTPKGWLQAPVDARTTNWTLRPAWDDKTALGFLHVVDVNGDKRPDVVTTSAHDYGVLWMEQGANGRWTRHVVDDAWSQAHASTLIDLNGDGRLDLVTGKRFMAHNGSDPGEREPLGLYWYEHRSTANGTVEWIRHLLDYGGRVGGGMQIPAVDLDGDGDLDLIVAGKSGLFLLENRTKVAGR